jgi:hypothetical protein
MIRLILDCGCIIASYAALVDEQTWGEMSGPIYKVYMGRVLAPWYELSKEEQDALLEKITEALKEAGGKPVVSGNASAFSDEWQVCGAEEFPDLDSVQKHAAALQKLEWFRYIESKSLLATPWEEDAPQPTET